jgi:hypothetical protein
MPTGPARNPRCLARARGRQENPSSRRTWGVLTPCATCGTFFLRIRTTALDSREDTVGDSASGDVLDDSVYFQLIEKLARLSVVDFVAVIQGARHRQRFGRPPVGTLRRPAAS